MYIKISNSYSFKDDIADVRKSVSKLKTSPDEFGHYGLISPENIESAEDANSTFLDVGTIHRDRALTGFSVDKMETDYLSIGNKPYLYLGRRLSLQQFKSILMLKG